MPHQCYLVPPEQCTTAISLEIFALTPCSCHPYTIIRAFCTVSLLIDSSEIRLGVTKRIPDCLLAAANRQSGMDKANYASAGCFTVLHHYKLGPNSTQMLGPLIWIFWTLISSVNQGLVPPFTKRLDVGFAKFSTCESRLDWQQHSYVDEFFDRMQFFIKW